MLSAFYHNTDYFLANTEFPESITKSVGNVGWIFFQRMMASDGWYR